MVVSLLQWYHRVLHKAPWKTTIISAGILTGTSDAVAQLFVENKKTSEYSCSRALRLTTMAMFHTAPIAKTWFHFLSTRVKSKSPALGAVKRVLLDQLFGLPFVISSLLFWLRVLEGYSLPESVDQMKTDAPKIWFRSLAVWPAAQLINFYFVPLAYRVVFVQTVSFFWNIYVSHASQFHAETP